MKKVGAFIAALLCIAVVCGGFYLVKVRSDENLLKDKTELTEVQRILMKDLANDYPATPREVVKLYNRIITAYYKESYSDQELSKMADQVLALFDAKLQETNPKDSYLRYLKADIANYESRSRYIADARVCDSDEVKFVQDGDDQLAYVTASYFVREKNEYSKTYQQYVLRKNGDGEWRILGFYQIEGASSKDDD